jgi:enoyl-CoA hydratase
MTGNYRHLLIERHGAVLTVHINRPEKRNALSREALVELGQAFTWHAADPELVAAVLTGTGNQSFAAGGDLKEFGEIRSEQDAGELFDLANRAFHAIRSFPLPVVAALNGIAVGGGAELSVACDFRLAAPHVRIGFVQGSLAISTGFGGGADLARLLGGRTALRLMLTAEILEAAQAKSIGLIDDISLPGETLEDCAIRFLGPIVRQRPQVVRAFKSIALAERMGLSRGEREQQERRCFVDTWTHPDHWAAVDKLIADMARTDPSRRD